MRAITRIGLDDGAIARSLLALSIVPLHEVAEQSVPLGFGARRSTHPLAIQIRPEIATHRLIGGVLRNALEHLFGDAEPSPAGNGRS